MTSFARADELTRLANDDPHAFLDALEHHGTFEEVLVQLLPLLHVRPDLAAQLRARLTWNRETLDVWLSRRLLALDSPTLAAFCALATARARAREPGFPEVSAAGLVLQNVGYYVDSGRVTGPGWLLDVEERLVGPAEVIREEDWTAEVGGAGWKLRICRRASGGLVDKVWEEDCP